jgi:hypothetical protein
LNTAARGAGGTLSLVKELSPSTSLLFERFFLVRKERLRELYKGVGLTLFGASVLKLLLEGQLDWRVVVTCAVGLIFMALYLLLD